MKNCVRLHTSNRIPAFTTLTASPGPFRQLTNAVPPHLTNHLTLGNPHHSLQALRNYFVLQCVSSNLFVYICPDNHLLLKRKHPCGVLLNFSVTIYVAHTLIWHKNKRFKKCQTSTSSYVPWTLNLVHWWEPQNWDSLLSNIFMPTVTLTK